MLEKYNAIELKHEKKSGVYLLFDGINIVYIGVAHDIHVRLWQHRKSEKIWDSAKWINEKDYYTALCIESELINHYRPIYNKTLGKLLHHESVNGIGAKYDISNYPSGWLENLPKNDLNKLKIKKELKALDDIIEIAHKSNNKNLLKIAKESKYKITNKF